MTRRQDFDDQMRAWAELGDERLPADYLKAALAQIERTPQRRSLAGWRFPPMNRFAPLALAATALVVVLLIGIGLILRFPNVGPSPVPSPTHTATPQPTTQAAAAWTATGSMLDARTGFTTTLLRDGKVLVAGGLGSGGESKSAEVYDPRTRSWATTGSMIDVRYSRQTATLLLDGRVLVAGGGDDSVLGNALASAELYDPASGSWTATRNMHSARLGQTATLLLDGRVLVAGGIGGGGGLTSAEVYDPQTGFWTPTGSMIEARDGHAATLLDDGMVLVAGGFAAGIDPQVSEPEVLASAEVYDPRTGSWTPTGSMSEVGQGRTITLLPDGTVLVAGGYSLTNHLWTDLTSAELYDPNSGSWTATAAPIGARFGPGATLLRDGMVLLVGGYSISNSVWTPLNSAELYDPGSGS